MAGTPLHNIFCAPNFERNSPASSFSSASHVVTRLPLVTSFTPSDITIALKDSFLAILSLAMVLRVVAPIRASTFQDT